MSTHKSDLAQSKREIFGKWDDGIWSYEDILEISDRNKPHLETEAIVAAKKWAKDRLFERDALLDEIHQTHKVESLKRIAFGLDEELYPRQIGPAAGDEIPLVFLDVETTGLSHKEHKLIELGFVKVLYSPGRKLITNVELVRSLYQDPGESISEEITLLTGIKDEDVKGKSIDVSAVRGWIGSDSETIIIAHNASFDRPFFNKLVGGEDYKWGCSVRQIDWRKNHNIESAKLDYILLKSGFYYTGHRASIDCLAMVQMFIKHPDALDEVLKNIDDTTVIIEATKAPFEMKDKLKREQYRWNAEGRVWFLEKSAKDECTERMKLEEIGKEYNYLIDRIDTKYLTARERFKSDQCR